MNVARRFPVRHIRFHGVFVLEQYLLNPLSESYRNDFITSLATIL